jgi:hypothetical protein
MTLMRIDDHRAGQIWSAGMPMPALAIRLLYNNSWRPVKPPTGSLTSTNAIPQDAKPARRKAYSPQTDLNSEANTRPGKLTAQAFSGVGTAVVAPQESATRLGFDDVQIARTNCVAS